MKKMMPLLLLLAGCGDFVSDLQYRCTPKTCAELDMECGTWEDGCGDTVDCGACSGAETCRADGQCVSRCQSSTCETMGWECGLRNDGCGVEIDCGTCPPEKECNAEGHCVEAGVVQEDAVSDCGGFEAAGGTLFSPVPAYCDAEVLHWRYEADTQTLKLADARVFLNCCGDHSMTVEVQESGTYLVTETDAPENGWGRCHCLCVFDFTVRVEGVPEETIHLKIVRVVTDEPEVSGDVFEGDIDLSLEAGEFIIDETDVADWCTEP